MSLVCEPYLKILNICFISVSLVASFTMTVLCLRKLKSNRKFIQLILGIACSDLVYSISNILSSVNQVELICYGEAIIREWSFNFSLLFVIAIAILCWRSSLSEVPDQSKYAKRVLFIGSAVYFMLTCPIFLLEDYVTVVNNGLWCFISYQDGIGIQEKMFVRAIYDWIPDAAFIMIALACFFKNFRFIIGQDGQEGFERIRLFGYSLIIFLIMLPTLFDNFFRIYYQCDDTWLIVLHIVLTHSAGTLNALFYGWQQKILRREESLLEFETATE